MSDFLLSLEKKQIGFTGTRDGMTPAQRLVVTRILLHEKPTKVHSGDCIGADATFHQIARQLGIWSVGHPPINPKNRAWCDFDEVEPEGDYHARDRNIVNASHLLLSTPATEHEVLRSGTWTTLRYARKIERPFKIILPSGLIRENTFE